MCRLGRSCALPQCLAKHSTFGGLGGRLVRGDETTLVSVA